MASQDTVEYTNRGTVLKITKDTVKRALLEADLGRTQVHFVEIDGKEFPLKKAFAKVAELDLLDFQTAEARSVFKKLGFKVGRKI